MPKHKVIKNNTNYRARSLVRNVGVRSSTKGLETNNFTFVKPQISQRFASNLRASKVSQFTSTIESNMRNTEKRKTKRNFPRPKASNMFGLDNDT